MKKLNGVYMFLFIAILWYLQVLIPNNAHKASEINAVIEAGNNALKNNVSGHVIKIEPVQSYLKSGNQMRNRVEQLEVDDSAPIFD